MNRLASCAFAVEPHEVRLTLRKTSAQYGLLVTVEVYSQNPYDYFVNPDLRPGGYSLHA